MNKTNFKTKIIFSAFLLLLSTTINPSHAQANFSVFICKLNPFCSEQLPRQSDRRSQADFQENIIKDTTLAQANMNNRFRFFKASGKVPSRGYVRVEYRFVGARDENGDETIYDDSDLNAKDFLNRSILDWAKSLFISGDRFFIVTLSARNKSTNEIFWIEPIIAFSSVDQFSKLEISDSLSFNGNSTFFQDLKDEIEITLEVRHARNSDVDIDLINDIFETAGSLASQLGGPALSVVNVMQSTNYRNIIKRISDKFDKFESVKSLSRKATVSYTTGPWIGFQYHFYAPDVEHKPFKLNVMLVHRESLLDQFVVKVEGEDEKAVLESSQVLNTSVKPRNSPAVQTLKAYFNSHPASNDVLPIYSSAVGNAIRACEKIREASAEIFRSKDLAIAALAFVNQNLGTIGSKRDPQCFSRVERHYLRQLRLELPEGYSTGLESGGGTARPLRPINKYFGRYLEDLGTILKVGLPQSEFIGAAIRTIKEQAVLPDGEPRSLLVFDPQAILISSASQRPRRIFPTDLVDVLLNHQFDEVGCWSRSIYSDSELDANVVALVMVKNKEFYETVVRFDQTPPNNVSRDTVVVDQIEFRKLTNERLSKYADAYNKKACASGMWPWRPSTS